MKVNVELCQIVTHEVLIKLDMESAEGLLEMLGNTPQLFHPSWDNDLYQRLNAMIESIKSKNG